VGNSNFDGSTDFSKDLESYSHLIEIGVVIENLENDLLAPRVDKTEPFSQIVGMKREYGVAIATSSQ